MKKLGIGCVTSLLLVLILCFSLYFWMASDSFYINTVDKTLSGDVAQVFTWALMENKEIKPLVTPELWPEIDRWMEIHEVFECPPSLRGFGAPGSYGGGGGTELHKITYDLTTLTYCPESTYSFGVRGLILERANGEWQVTGWGEICEIRPGEDGCTDPLNQQQ